MQTLDELGGGTLRVITRLEGERALVEFIGYGPDSTGKETDLAGKPSSLALSACYGIIQDHDGRIFSDHLPEGGTRVCVELPTNSGEVGPLIGSPSDISLETTHKSALPN